jgi:phenol 2-monooxygenase
MQFHLNGFHAGDPAIKNADPEHQWRAEFPSEVDVLIVGSGPAGLTLAAQLAQFPSIATRVVERRAGPLALGQADGISCRTMEMFNAFGFGDRVAAEGYQVNEVSFWMPDPDNVGGIRRVGRVPDVPEGLSEMPHIILNQARVHDFYLEHMRYSPTRLEVDYGLQFQSLDVNVDDVDYPVTVTIDDTNADEVIITRARYVVGCDGARSQVRTAIGRDLKGDYQYQAWGVMDVLAITDFPDIRLKSIVKSANEGNILIIPREGGYLVRIYVELDSLGERGGSRETTLEEVIAATQRIFRPFSFDVQDVAWWSVYEVGHSLTDRFDDVPDEQVGDRTPRVFIAGDACHTHSAKAGQGMNVSMGDTFNLGWKLVSVLEGRCGSELLHTYSAERQTVAQALIDFDHEWSRIMSAPAEQNAHTDIPRVQKHFVEGGEFTAGLSVRYDESSITASARWQELAPGFQVGTRFHSVPVVRISDAKSVHLGHVVRADVRWHIFIFSDLNHNRARTFCDYLAHDANSPILKHTPTGADIDAVISTCGVLQEPHHAIEFMSLPAILRPSKGKFQILDFEKAYCVNHGLNKDAFDSRGIDRDQGCMVVVRPDQYVAAVFPLDAYEELQQFFAGVLWTVASTYPAY